MKTKIVSGWVLAGVLLTLGAQAEVPHVADTQSAPATETAHAQTSEKTSAQNVSELADSEPKPDAAANAGKVQAPGQTPTDARDSELARHLASAEQQHAGALKQGDTLAAGRLALAIERWKHAAAALTEGMELSRKAAKLEQEITELQTRTKRARSLVEQTEIRRARAMGELRRLGIEAVETKRPAEETHATPVESNPSKPVANDPSPPLNPTGEAPH